MFQWISSFIYFFLFSNEQGITQDGKVLFNVRKNDWFFVKNFSIHSITKLAGWEWSTHYTPIIISLESWNTFINNPLSNRNISFLLAGQRFLHFYFDDQMDFLQHHKVLDNFSIKIFCYFSDEISFVWHFLWSVRVGSSEEGDNMCVYYWLWHRSHRRHWEEEEKRVSSVVSCLQLLELIQTLPILHTYLCTTIWATIFFYCPISNSILLLWFDAVSYKSWI